MRKAGKFAAGGFAAGFLLGAVVWGTHMQRSKRDLFSSSSVKRLAALGSLRASLEPGTVGLLKDYVRWERNPSLRRRGEKLLARIAATTHK